MRQFKPLKGQKHIKPSNKNQKARKRLQKVTRIEEQRKPRVKRNGVLITKNMKDKIVEDLKKEFDIRSCVGIDKYKTTLQDNNKDNFLQHLKEELMDAALYIQKLQSND
tara:strand:+ start:2200 stop:2526 length:327 start_codon:yes stop_codon:yes gene_type:complete